MTIKKGMVESNHHMHLAWQDFMQDDATLVINASLREKSAIVGRIGLLMLANGAGAYRVRESMNDVATMLNLTCASDVGLMTINFTCFDAADGYTQILDLANTAVNTDKLNSLEALLPELRAQINNITLKQIHQQLDRIYQLKGNYRPVHLGLAAALACAGFIFLLGGGWPEIFCAFIGAGIGNFTRASLTKRHVTTLVGLVSAVAMAGVFYFLSLQLLHVTFNISLQHEAGYIGAMLFVVPGFPLITSFLDLSKLDIRSGIERLTFALIITITAAMVGWLVALALHIHPANFITLGLSPTLLLLLRLVASFCGVFGFSIMFNSPIKMATTAALIGAFANTLRLELVDFTTMPPAAAALIGALTAGLLASIINKYRGYPRIALTVPAIVIMVPGLYIYRGVYNLGINQLAIGANWLTKAALIILAIAFGLFFARVLTDRDWQHAG